MNDQNQPEEQDQELAFKQKKLTQEESEALQKAIEEAIKQGNLV